MNVWQYYIDTVKRFYFFGLCDTCAQLFEKVLGDHCRLSLLWAIPKTCQGCGAQADNDNYPVNEVIE